MAVTPDDLKAIFPTTLSDTQLTAFIDAAALVAVDDVLGPLLLDPKGSDTFGDLQESCTLLWRLAEGVTLAEPLSAYTTKASPLPPEPGPED